MITETDIETVRGLPVHGDGGTSLGLVDSVYRDAETSEPLFALVEFEAGRAVLPLTHAEMEDGALVTPYSVEQVRSAPPFGNELDLTKEQEQQIFKHFGLPTTVETA